MLWYLLIRVMINVFPATIYKYLFKLRLFDIAFTNSVEDHFSQVNSFRSLNRNSYGFLVAV